MHEYCKYLVIQFHVVSYEYFCDQLQDYELSWMLQNMNYAYKEEWEQTRYKLYYTIAPYTKNKANSIQEFFPLTTDKEIKEDHNYEISGNQIELLKEKAKRIEAIMNKEG